VVGVTSKGIGGEDSYGVAGERRELGRKGAGGEMLLKIDVGPSSMIIL